MSKLLRNVSSYTSIRGMQKNTCGGCGSGSMNKEPRHLICFKDWTSEMVVNVLMSALALKLKLKNNSHCVRLDTLKNCKVTILKEVNEPMLSLAVSKAATMLGAFETTVIDSVMWDQDYAGKIFSKMSDIIFVSTAKHGCVQRFAKQSTVPVMCMMSRAHASIQALATILTVIEEFNSISNLNFAYIGAPHQVLNSYLLLCPMLGANIRFKCCCELKPVSPLLLKASEGMTEKTKTLAAPCKTVDELLECVNVVIAGPGTKKRENVKTFSITTENIECSAKGQKWIFIHTLPKGPETDDKLFLHQNSRTFKTFENYPYIAAALMAYGIKDKRFNKAK